MSQTNNIKIFKGIVELCESTANFIIDLANKCIAANGQFVLVLSGGSTPNELYKLLATESYKERMPWKNTVIFWGDERCVGLDDKLNNAYVAKSLLLDKIDIHSSNLHITPVDLPPAEAAIKYEQDLKSFFKNKSPQFDLLFLGLGENAHTASLFPGTPVLHEKDRWVKEVYVEEQKMYRVTMTEPVINQARNIIFLVTGKAKAAVLHTIFNSPYQPELYPAQLIKPVNGNLFWYVDEAAAAQL
ncbi:MAG TPA: 6-phosphogluconolactonase [Ferruginibacter sp.]|nr:6-phosphogluconolactonase [Ferruginibacter sp.]